MFSNQHNSNVYFKSPYHYTYRKTDQEREIKEWRSAIRKSGYLQKDGDHVSFSGKPLDNKLINFETKCMENKKEYYSKFPDACKLEQVFITPEDRSKANDITRKTNNEIIQYIEEMLNVSFFIIKIKHIGEYMK